MKARTSVAVFLIVVLLMPFFTMAFMPMMVRAQEGGPVLTGPQLVYLGIVASGLLWLLRLLSARGYKPKREIVAIGLYVVSFAVAIFFSPVTFPAFPQFTDAPSFVGALITYASLLISLAAPVVGMAFLVYNWLLKRVLDGVANQVAKAFAAPTVKTHGVVVGVRAKFKVVSVTDHDYGDGKTIKLTPCYDASIPEDRRFAQATPTGEMSMYVNNPPSIEFLKLGKFFYLDFTPVE